MSRENMFEINDFSSAYNIVKKFAVQNGWVFDHAPEQPDVMVALENMIQQEIDDELPDDIRPAYRVVMHKFTQLFEPASSDDEQQGN